MSFDTEQFARLVVSEVRSLGADPVEVQELQDDIEAVLAALDVERNPRRRTALVGDLIQFLPVRAQRISTACPVATDALVFLSRVTILVARSFS